MSTPELKPSATEEIETTVETEKPAEVTTPTWFAATYPQSKPEDMAERYIAARQASFSAPPRALPDEEQTEAYEAYRRRLEDRFQTAKRQAEVIARPTMPDAPSPRRPRASQAVAAGGAEDFQHWQNALQARQANNQRVLPRRPSATRIAALLIVACSVGGAAGYGSSKINSLPSVMAQITATANSLFSYLPSAEVKTDNPPIPVKRETVISKKLVRMARVDVQDTKGPLNGPIPLNIVAFPADDATPLALRITGIPQDAYLTRGVEISTGEWLLKASEVANLQLVVPHADVAQLDLAVAAVEERTGIAAAPPREMTVDLDLGSAKVVPANAAPELQTNAVPPPLETAGGEARLVLGKGEKLMQSGDVVSARPFFIKAHELGSKDAAYRVGQTFDPMVYERMNVRGLKPDSAEAKAWYEKAAAAGNAEAQAALQSMLSVLQP